MSEFVFRGNMPLRLQLSKAAEGEIVERFGTVEDFELSLGQGNWYVNAEGTEYRLVSYEKNLAIVCDPQAPNETRTEPYLVAKYLKNKTANDKYGAFGTELERPVKVFKAKPKDWSQVEKRQTLQTTQQKKAEFTCNTCHREIVLTEKFCTACGTQINWQCSKCHKPYDVAHMNYCPHCGVPRDVVKKTEETNKNDSEEIEKDRAVKFWELNWPDDQVIGFITFTGSRDLLYELEANNHAEYMRVYDAMVMIWNHRKETGSIQIKRADGWIYLMGDMKRGSKAWIANVFQENKFGKLLDAYEVKLALKEARRQRSPRRPNTH